MPDDGAPVVLDLSRAASATEVGRRLLREGVERMREDGREVRVADPDGLLDG